jgi:hypothetical protein
MARNRGAMHLHFPPVSQAEIDARIHPHIDVEDTEHKPLLRASGRVSRDCPAQRKQLLNSSAMWNDANGRWLTWTHAHTRGG